MPPQYREVIWGMFQKLDQDSEGTGVGLALVKKVTERMKGRVGVESEAGKMKDPKTILYVEDEENDVVMLQFALKKAKVETSFHTVKNGEEALAYLGGTGMYSDRARYPMPGLVLLDLKIPRICGLKVLEWIRAQAPLANVPVVIYTSGASPHESEKARQLGAADCIVKPAGIDETIAMARMLKEQWLDSAL